VNPCRKTWSGWSRILRGFSLLLVLALGHGGGRGHAVSEPRPGHESREALFAAFKEAVRNVDPEAILELCDEDTVKVGLVFVSDVDPRSIPQYAAIPGLPECIENQRDNHRLTVLEKIPHDLRAPRERLLAALKIRMLNSGEEYCRNYEGRLEGAAPLFELEGIEGYEEYTEEELKVCEDQWRSFPIVKKNGRWYIGYYGGLILTTKMYQTLDRMAP